MERSEHYIGTSENYESYKLDKTRNSLSEKQPKVLLMSQCEIAFVVIMKNEKGFKISRKGRSMRKL